MENLNPKPLEPIPMKPLDGLLKRELERVAEVAPPSKIKLNISDYANIVKAFFINRAIDELQGKTTSSWLLIIFTIITIITVLLSIWGK